MADPLRLQLKVAPKAARDAVNGWIGETLKVSVTAAPERGKANEAVVALLATTLGLPRSALSIVRGHGSVHKLVEIRGLDAAELRRRLQ